MEWGCRLPQKKKKVIDYESCFFFFTQKFSAWCRKKLLCGTQNSTKTRTNMSTLKERGKTVTSLPYVLFDWTVQLSPTTRIWPIGAGSLVKHRLETVSICAIQRITENRVQLCQLSQFDLHITLCSFKGQHCHDNSLTVWFICQASLKLNFTLCKFTFSLWRNPLMTVILVKLGDCGQNLCHL